MGAKIRCTECGTELESKFRHDYQSCDCPNQTSADGGNDYGRYGGKDLNKIEVFDGKCWKKLLKFTKEIKNESRK